MIKAKKLLLNIKKFLKSPTIECGMRDYLFNSFRKENIKITLFLYILNIAYLVMFWKLALFNILLFSLFIMAGFWFFTSFSFFFNLKYYTQTEITSKLGSKQIENITTDLIKISYFMSFLTVFISTILIIIITYFGLYDSSIIGSGYNALNYIHSIQYVPSIFELILLCCIWIVSIIFPIYFCKWITQVYFIKNSKVEENSLMVNYNFSSFNSILAITYFCFMIFYPLNYEYIDSKVNIPSLKGLEFLIPFSFFALITELVILVSILLFLKNKQIKFKNYPKFYNPTQ